MNYDLFRCEILLNRHIMLGAWHHLFKDYAEEVCDTYLAGRVHPCVVSELLENHQTFDPENERDLSIYVLVNELSSYVAEMSLSSEGTRIVLDMNPWSKPHVDSYEFFQSLVSHFLKKSVESEVVITTAQQGDEIYDGPYYETHQIAIRLGSRVRFFDTYGDIASELLKNPGFDASKYLCIEKPVMASPRFSLLAHMK